MENNLQDRIPSTLSQTAVMDVLNHEVGRQRIITVMKEREGTTDFENVVFAIIQKYLKIKATERILWFVGLIVAGLVGYFIKR